MCEREREEEIELRRRKRELCSGHGQRTNGQIGGTTRTRGKEVVKYALECANEKK